MDLTDLMTEQDRLVFDRSGHGIRMGFGKRPVVLVVDVNYEFCGDKREPILLSIRTWRNSSGEAAWDAIENIKPLLEIARQRGVPVIYSTSSDGRADGFDAGRWADKNRRSGEARLERTVNGNAIVDELSPYPQDLIVYKSKPSVFFGTLLESYLTDLGADSIIVCGGTTSGCVRATVVDGFSFNYRMSVVEPCTFDRGELSHRVSLFDLNLKYADVVDLEEILAYLASVPEGLFLQKLPSLGGSTA